ncbi:bcl-2-binding component 3, isoforms 3/4-like [Falco biarmicus]|uniref:bcl-2-binding component 3, isoforms 3/4-like n=1 Tax=Falco biarmicus TaxID=345155 RepID=UPI0024BCFE60|nr:bcl-2-binding component 3, isoforms 3/4-like [Falco biarmicus]
MEVAERGRLLRQLGAELMHTHPPRGAARRVGPRGHGQRLPLLTPQRGVQARAARRLGPPGAALVTAAIAAAVGDSLTPAREPRERTAASPSLPPGEAEGLVPSFLPRRWHALPFSFPQPAWGGRAAVSDEEGLSSSGRRNLPCALSGGVRPAAARLAGSPPGAAQRGRWGVWARQADAINSAPPPQGGSASGSHFPGLGALPSPPAAAAARPAGRLPWEAGQHWGKAPSGPQPQREPPRGRRGSFPTDVSKSPVQLLPKLILILKKLT